MPTETRPLYCDPLAITDEPRAGFVEISRCRGRSPEQLRFYWAVLGRVIASCGTPFASVEHLSDALKLECGLVEFVKTMTGDVLIKPASISFRAMPHDAFTAYARDAFSALSVHYLGGEPVEILFDMPRADVPALEASEGGADVPTAPPSNISATPLRN